jgi:hypothetical protein
LTGITNESIVMRVRRKLSSSKYSRESCCRRQTVLQHRFWFCCHAFANEVIRAK